MKDGFEYFSHEIDAYCTKSIIERVATYPLGILCGGLIGGLFASVGVAVAVVASPAILATGALGMSAGTLFSASVAGSSLLGGTAGFI